MSIELVKEVLYHCPEGLDGTARLLLLVLAEKSQDKDRTERGRFIAARTCFPSQDELMRLTGIRTGAGLRAVYNKLAKFNLDPRIAIGSDKNGQPVFARHGHQTNFRVPELAKGATTVAAPTYEGATTVAAPTYEGATTVAGRGNQSFPKEQPQLPPNHKEPEVTLPPTPQPERNVTRSVTDRREGEENLILRDLASWGLDLDEARAVIDHAKKDPQTVSPRKRLQQPAYLAQCRQAIIRARANTYATGAKCVDHPTEVAANCRACKADVKCGDREFRFIGKHQPQCSVCADPLLNYPDGTTTCTGCAVAVSA